MKAQDNTPMLHKRTKYYNLLHLAPQRFKSLLRPLQTDTITQRQAKTAETEKLPNAGGILLVVLQEDEI